jgi:hypothetical protein
LVDLLIDAIDTYGDAVSQRQDAETLAVEGCLAGFEFGGGCS